MCFEAVLNPEELLFIDFPGPGAAFIFHMQLMKPSRPLNAVTEISHTNNHTHPFLPIYPRDNLSSLELH